MRAWLIILEVAISIVILTTFYFYITTSTPQENSFYYSYEEFRGINYNCQNFPNLIYYYNNFSSKVYCIFGKQGSAKDVIGRRPIFSYLYSGWQNYEPHILVIYK